MAKTELLARLRTTCDALTTTFRQVQAEEWMLVTDYKQLTIHDALNYTMAFLELTGNWYLQSLRMPPVHTTATIEHEAVLYAERRRSRPIDMDLADFVRARQGLFVLLDMASEEQLVESVAARPREAQITDLAIILTQLDAAIHRTLRR